MTTKYQQNKYLENKDRVMGQIKDFMMNYNGYVPVVRRVVKKLNTEFFSGEALYTHIRDSI